jgi:hypothetical protein
LAIVQNCKKKKKKVVEQSGKQSVKGWPVH